MSCTGCHRCFSNIAGSGVLIITDSNTFAGKHDVVLFKDHTGTFNDAGGKSEGLPSLKTASKELYEESRTTVNVPENVLYGTKYIDIGKSRKHIYRCYILYIPKVSCASFYHVDTRGMSHCYLETTQMTRFPIPIIQDMLQKRPLSDYLVDDKNRQLPLGSRARDVLTKLFL
jgi:hypothetical protein